MSAWNVTFRNARESDYEKLGLKAPRWSEYMGQVVVLDDRHKDAQIILLMDYRGVLLYQNGTDGVADMLRAMKLIWRGQERGVRNREVDEREAEAKREAFWAHYRETMARAERRAEAMQDTAVGG